MLTNKKDFIKGLGEKPDENESKKGEAAFHGIYEGNGKATGKNSSDNLDQYRDEVESSLRLIRDDPQNLEAIQKLSEAYFHLGLWKEASLNYLKAIKINPSDSKSYRSLGKMYSRLGRDEEAILAFQSVVRLNQSDPESVICLGKLLSKRGRFQEVIEYYCQALQVNTRMTESLSEGGAEEALHSLQKNSERIVSELVNAYISMGKRLEQQGKHEESIVCYSQVSLVNPYDVENLLLRSHILIKLKRLDEAAELCRQIKFLAPEIATIQSELGNRWLEMGDDAQAIEFFKNSIRLDSKNKRGYDGLGSLYMRQGKHREAVEVFNQEAQVLPEYIVSHCHLGTLFLYLDEYSSAIDSLERAKSLNPNLYQIHFNLGVAYAYKEKWNESRDSFERVLQLKHGHPGAYLGLGIAYDVLGQRDLALKTLNELRQIDPIRAKKLSYEIELIG